MNQMNQFFVKIRLKRTNILHNIQKPYQFDLCMNHLIEFCEPIYWKDQTQMNNFLELDILSLKGLKYREHVV